MKKEFGAKFFDFRNPFIQSDEALYNLSNEQ